MSPVVADFVAEVADLRGEVLWRADTPSSTPITGIIVRFSNITRMNFKTFRRIADIRAALIPNPNRRAVARAPTEFLHGLPLRPAHSRVRSRTAPATQRIDTSVHSATNRAHAR